MASFILVNLIANNSKIFKTLITPEYLTETAKMSCPEKAHKLSRISKPE
jgi:hypothetical protein